MARALYTIGLNPRKAEQAINAKIERLIQLTGRNAPRIVREANVESLHWIQAKALEGLETQIRVNKRPGFPSDFRDHTLEQAIVNDQFSSADGRGIRFLIDARIRRDVPYYASLEYGDRSQIGRRIPFFFFGTDHHPYSLNRRGAPGSDFIHPQAPDFLRGNSEQARTPAANGPGEASHKTDRIVGPREYKNRVEFTHGALITALIRRPVPEYRYGRDAGKAFLEQAIYQKLLNAQIQGSGLRQEGVQFVIHGT